MEKEPVSVIKTVQYITQTKYRTDGVWFDRFKFTDLLSAQADLKEAQKMNPLKAYKYRLVRCEVVQSTFVEQE